MTYKEKLALRKSRLEALNVARINAKEVRKLEKEKLKVLKEKEKADKKAGILEKIEAKKQTPNNPQRSIKAETFIVESTDDSDDYNENDYFYEDDQVEKSDNNPWNQLNSKHQALNGMGTMGFDIFGVNIDTSALAAQAQALAQAQVNKYLAPTAPVNAQPAQPAPTTTTETNYITQGIDPAMMKNIILGGKIFGGLVAGLLGIKIVMAVMPSFSKK